MTPPLTNDRKPHATPEPHSIWLANILRERIIWGEYPPGHKLPTKALQDEFGISNGPVREAIQILVNDGLAEQAPWRSVRVIELGEKEIIELFELRVGLLELAAELAAKRATPETLAKAGEIRRYLDDLTARRIEATKGGADDRMVSLDQQNRHFAEHGSLIEWVLEGAGNNKIKEVWSRTMLQTRIYIHKSAMRHISDNSPSIGYKLIDAIVARDIEESRRAAREMTRSILQHLEIKATF